MNKAIVVLSAGIAGAVLMYILDPELGRRRRGLLADKGTHFLKLLGRAVGTAPRDVSDRVQGVVAKGTHLFKTQSATDAVLVERIRAELGRIISSPSSVTVKATNGVVVVSGTVLRQEHTPLLRHLREVRGVQFVHDRLSFRDTGQLTRKLANWPPVARAFAFTAWAGATLLTQAIPG